MSGLREYVRDAQLLEASGDAQLVPPSPQALLQLAVRYLVRPDAPIPAAARWVYARWKPGTSLTAGFELDYGDGTGRWVTWKGYADGKAAAILQRRERSVAAEVADERLREHCVLPEGRAHLWAPPYDRELPGLERALDLRRAKRWFLEQGLFEGRRVRSGSSRAELLRYKPERRAVLCLDLRLRPVEGGPKTAAKLAARALPPAEAERVARARRAWQQGASGALAPRLLAHEAESGLLFEAWLDLETFGPRDFSTAHEAGALLARLHAERAPLVERVAQHGLAGALELLATQPGLARWCRRLATDRPVQDDAQVWIHGDFHPDQIARERSDGALRLLDLDRLGAGAAVCDLASWIADHLVENPQVGLGQASWPLMQGYLAGGGEPPDTARLAGQVATELVQRAAAALRRLERGGLDKAERLLAQARELAPPGVLFA